MDPNSRPRAPQDTHPFELMLLELGIKRRFTSALSAADQWEGGTVLADLEPRPDPWQHVRLPGVVPGRIGAIFALLQ